MMEEIFRIFLQGKLFHIKSILAQCCTGLQQPISDSKKELFDDIIDIYSTINLGMGSLFEPHKSRSDLFLRWLYRERQVILNLKFCNMLDGTTEGEYITKKRLIEEMISVWDEFMESGKIRHFYASLPNWGWF